MMQGPGPWGGGVWSPGEGEGQQGGRGHRGGAAQHRAGPACATKRSVSPAAGVPQRLPAYGQGGGSQPSREQTSPGEQTLTGFLYFRKAASATCPFLTPTQVGHPATSPCPALPWASLWDRPGPLCLEPQPRFSLWGDVLGPVERGVRAEGPTGSGLCPSGGATSSWPQPLPGACVCGQPVFRPRQAKPGHTEVLPPPQRASSVPTLRGCLCACPCAEFKPRSTGVGTQGPLSGDADPEGWTHRGVRRQAEACPVGPWPPPLNCVLAGETPAGPSVMGLLFPRLPRGHAVQLSHPSVWRAEAPRAHG